jgi:C_GCAxxG_C_C family probable redox protein
LTRNSNDLFEKGYNCAQSVVGAYCEKYGLDFDSTMKLASTFGGGLGIKKTCGAITGACMVLGLEKGFSTKVDLSEKDALKKLTNEFIEKFKNTNGFIDCEEILNELENTLGHEPTMNEKRKHCTNVIKNSTSILDTYLK